MAALNEANVERKLQAVSNTQDSIQSLSLWVIHHKAHHEKIVSIWLKVVKKSNTKHRLTLFYLCNDIVQTCKRKHAIVYKDAFKEILKEAVVHVRDAGIRSNIERIFKIWGDRNVYDVKFIEELTDIINNSTSRSVISRLLAEFQPEQALEKITSYEKLETENELRKAAVSLLRLDTSTIETIRQLKDRDKGREYSQQFEDGCVKLEEYLAHSDLANKDRVSLIELLEQSELFYDAQYSEAKVVANAYKNFGTRVSNLKKKLDEFMKTLPSPIPTPSSDAPSPEQSPVYPVNEDNTEAIDMEMSDSDNDAPALVETHTGAGSGGSRGRRDSTITTKAYPKPIASVTEIHMRHKNRKRKSSEPADEFKSIMDSSTKSSFMTTKSKKAGSPDKTWESMLAAFKSSSKSARDKEEDETEVNPISVVSHSVGRVSSMEIYNDQDEGEGTPVIDELSNTPVMDEGPDENMSNPIEFLTQLINQTKNAGSTTGGNFLESLSALQPGNSSQYGNGEHSEAKVEAVSETASPNSWAAWKAAQNPPPPPPPPQPVPPVGQQQPPYPTQPPPPVRQQPSYNPSATPPPPPPIQQQPPYPSATPMMVPPPFPPSMHSIPSQQQPNLQMPPQPGTPASQAPGPPPPVPAPMMVQPPPPPMAMPMGPPQSMSSWQHQHPVGHPPPPPVQPPVNTNNLSPPVSSGYNITQPPPPPPPQLQPSPLKSPPAQIMMNALLRKRANSSNLKEIPVLDDNQAPEGAVTPPSPKMSGGRPVRPAFPPTSPMGSMQGPRPPVGPPSSSPSASQRTVSDDQQEFIEKLKRKSNAMSPTSAPATTGLQKPEAGKNLRALTEINADESDDGAEKNKPQEKEEVKDTETSPSESSSKGSGDASSEGPNSNANQKPDKSSETGKEPAQEQQQQKQQQRSERPPQRIQSVATRVVNRIETTSDTRRFDTHNYDRREEYGDPYQRDSSREHYERYGDRYGYDRQRDYYQRDSYGNRSGPKRPQHYDRHSYSGYPRY